MRLNDKGYMLVEVIVSFTLAIIILFFMTNATISLKNKADDLYLETKLEADQMAMTTAVMKDINSMDLKTVNSSGTCVILGFRNGATDITKKIAYETTGGKNYFKYGKIANGSTDCNSGFTDNATLYTKEIDRRLNLNVNGSISSNTCYDGNCKAGSKANLKVAIPGYTAYSDKDYGFMINLDYNYGEITVKGKESLYDKIKCKYDETPWDNKSSTFVDSGAGIDFNKSPYTSYTLNENTGTVKNSYRRIGSYYKPTNGVGLYKRYGEYDEKNNPICYYRGYDTVKANPDSYGNYVKDSSTMRNITAKYTMNNNVVFAGYCWHIVRTTETGGVKLQYYGKAINNKCSGNDKKVRNTILDDLDLNQLNVSTDLYYMYSFNGYTSKSNNGISVLDSLYMSGTTMAQKKAGKEGCPGGKNVKDVKCIQNNYIKGKSVTYNNGKYTLVGTANISDHSILDYYTCFSTSNQCDTVAYFMTTSGDGSSYIEFKNGDTFEKYYERMIHSNDTSSYLKKALEQWYKTNLSKYDTYIDKDVVFYYNRESSSKIPTSFMGNYEFNGINDKNHPTLMNKTNKRDNFSVSNKYGNGALTYPIGLLSADEVLLAGILPGKTEVSSISERNPDDNFLTHRNHVFEDSEYQWLGTPIGTRICEKCGMSRPMRSFVYAIGVEIGSSTSQMLSRNSGYNNGLYAGTVPIIALSPNAPVTGNGDGSETNPYIIG